MAEQQDQSQYRAVHFHVTEGAQSQLLGGLPLLYVGMTYHIPRNEIEEAQRVREAGERPALPRNCNR